MEKTMNFKDNTDRYFSDAELAELEKDFDSDEFKSFLEEYAGDSISESNDNMVYFSDFDDKTVNLFKLVISNGYSSLSVKQRELFKEIMSDTLVSCYRCGEFMWNEATCLIEYGLCEYCKHMFDKENY